MKKAIVLARNLSGVDFWRHYAPSFTISTLGLNDLIIETRQDFPKTEFEYEGVCVVILSGFHSQQHLDYFRWLHQVHLKYGFLLLYSIDDLPFPDYIPDYNAGKKYYEKTDTQNVISTIIKNCDFVLTTTEFLKEKLSECYGISPARFIIVPNLTPRWWIGSGDLNVMNFKHHKSKGKLRALVSSSTAHFSSDGSVPDDLTIIEQSIKDTSHFIDWFVFADKRESLSGHIHTIPSCPIIQYPQVIKSIAPDFIVAPLMDNVFNRCKSNIKVLESAALGVPLYASHIPTYTPYLPDNQLFTTADDLTEKIKDMSTMSANRYQRMCQRQIDFLNRPFNSQGYSVRSWWLEDNLQLWTEIFAMTMDNNRDEIVPPDICI